ncbi:AGTR1 [Branchiostoma lanceolatum]|uniref:AGTR1 protein n=1 Tax=Branchiostoma lanceolatum TaxID=7740 RepID=A0A8J9ZE64_BRALA|nr:AGTR1 [Branchiostoma lanceolatum]
MESGAVTPLYAANVTRCLLSALGVAANLLILYIIAKYATIRTISNVYVANLAVADVSFCLFALAQGVFSIRFHSFKSRVDNLLGYCQQMDVDVAISSENVAKSSVNVANSSANVANSSANVANSGVNVTMSNATAEFLLANNCTWRNMETRKLHFLLDAKLNCDSADLVSSRVCDVGRVLAVFLACASIFLLTAIAVERHRAVLKPLDHRLRRTQRKALRTCLLMWLLAFLAATFDTVVRNLVADDWTFTYTSLFECVYLKPDDAASGHSYLSLAITISFILYVVPAGVMIPIYIRIFVTLRQPRPFPARASASRTLHMIFVVTVFFLVCWLPFHVTSFTAHSYTQGDSLVAFYVATALAILNSVINPFIYAFIGKNFRQHIKRLFCSSSQEEDIGTRYRASSRPRIDSIYGYRDSVIGVDTAVLPPSCIAAVLRSPEVTPYGISSRSLRFTPANCELLAIQPQAVTTHVTTTFVPTHVTTAVTTHVTTPVSKTVKL